MARNCSISGRGHLRGNTVSHANNRRKKVWQANLHTKRLYNSETGKWVTLRVSSRVLRTIDKLGLAATLRQFKVAAD